MSVLPSQKLTIGELYVSMAVGLILYLLPGDIRNQMNSMVISEIMVFISTLTITAVFFFIIKRYEAIGAALLTNSIITAGAFGFGIIHGLVSKGADYWPTISEYSLISMFIIWIVPFLFAVVLRTFSRDGKDLDDLRQGFSRFLSLSLRALMIIYILVIVFQQLLPHYPKLSVNRSIYYLPFVKIQECLDNFSEWGGLYLFWNGLILMPLTFSLLVLNPKIRWWQALFISFAAGFAIEIIQFSLNTGTVYVDDIILYMIGGLIGYLLKRIIDLIRYRVSGKQEKNMLSLDYSPFGAAAHGLIEVYDGNLHDDDDTTEALIDDEFDDTLRDPVIAEDDKTN